MIWTPSFHTDLVFPKEEDGCRHIVWSQPVQDKVMQGHVIRSMEVPHEGSCKVICYTEPNCVSINVRPATQEGKYICELNNATGESESSSVLQSKEGHIFVSIEVLRTDFLWRKEFFFGDLFSSDVTRVWAIFFNQSSIRRFNSPSIKRSIGCILEDRLVVSKMVQMQRTFIVAFR